MSVTHSTPLVSFNRRANCESPSLLPLILVPGYDEEEEEDEDDL